MTISQRILELMEQKNIKQKQLAEYTGISSSAISDWKKKGTNPSVDKISIIADYLEVSVDYLLGRTDKLNEYDNISTKNKRLIEAYHNHPELQPAVDKLFDLVDESEK